MERVGSMGRFEPMPTLEQLVHALLIVPLTLLPILGALFVGTYVLDFFGISLPIVRVGGGLLVAASGWRMLDRSEDDEVRVALQPAQLT